MIRSAMVTQSDDALVFNSRIVTFTTGDDNSSWSTATVESSVLFVSLPVTTSGGRCFTVGVGETIEGKREMPLPWCEVCAKAVVVAKYVSDR